MKYRLSQDIYLQCFQIVVLGNTLETALDSKIKPVNPKGNQLWTFLERLMLKLKFQYFGHLMWRASSLEKTLMLGTIEGKKRGRQRMRWLGNITDLMDMNLSQLQKTVKDSRSWRAVIHGVAKSWTQLRDWTTTTFYPYRALFWIYQGLT